MVTVKEVMSSNALKQAHLVAGINGTDRRVDNISFIERPDFLKWIQSNDIVITNLYLYQDSVYEQCQMLKNLLKTTCVGLVIKMNISVNSLAEEFLKIADDNNFPIYTIPAEMPYSLVIAEIYNTVLADKNPKSLQEKFLKDIFFDMYDDVEYQRERGRAVNAFSNGCYYVALTLKGASSVKKNDINYKKFVRLATQLSQVCLIQPLVNNCIDVYCLDSIVLMLEFTKEFGIQKSLDKILSHINTLLGKLNMKGMVKAGVGRAGSDISGIQFSFHSSRLAIESGQILYPDEVFYRYDSIEFEAFMLKQIRSETAYFSDVVDKLQNQSLVKTLGAYFDCNFDIEKTAKCMFVHPNTIRYRLRTISEKTGLDYRQSRDLLKLYISLIAVKTRR